MALQQLGQVPGGQALSELPDPCIHLVNMLDPVLPVPKLWSQQRRHLQQGRQPLPLMRHKKRDKDVAILTRVVPVGRDRIADAGAADDLTVIRITD